MTLSTYTKEFSYNLKLAYPIILGMLGHTVVGIVDNIMVGKLGPAELAAVSLGNSFVFIAMSVGIGFSTAITPLVAEADGKGDVEKGRSAFHHGLYLCTILGVVLFGIIYFSKPLISFMGQPENVVELPIRMTSEDFAYYSQEIPACFYRLGTGNPARGITSPVHTNTFDVDEECLLHGMGLMAWLAMRELGSKV